MAPCVRLYISILLCIAKGQSHTTLNTFFKNVFVFQRGSSGAHIPINERGKSKAVVLLGQVVFFFRTVTYHIGASFTKAWGESKRAWSCLMEPESARNRTTGVTVRPASCVRSCANLPGQLVFTHNS